MAERLTTQLGTKLTDKASAILNELESQAYAICDERPLTGVGKGAARGFKGRIIGLALEIAKPEIEDRLADEGAYALFPG